VTHVADVVHEIKVSGAIGCVQILHAAVGDVQGFAVGYREGFTEVRFTQSE
jgi:hypothetical protein